MLDELIPDYDAVERHAVVVHASADHVYGALYRTDFGRIATLRVLLAFRALPTFLAERMRRAPRATAPRDHITLQTFMEHGFVLVDEVRDRELVLGLLGRFWRPTGGRLRTDAAGLRQMPPLGCARALWNFTVTAQPDGSTLLATETRVQCAGDRARRAFRAYWLLVRPFSGLLRRLMLAEIRRVAEIVAA